MQSPLLSIPSKRIFNKNTSVKQWQSCLKPRTKEAYTFRVLPMASAWGRTGFQRCISYLKMAGSYCLFILIPWPSLNYVKILSFAPNCDEDYFPSKSCSLWQSVRLKNRRCNCLHYLSVIACFPLPTEPGYVAISQASSFENVAITITESYRQRTENDVKYVYREVL
jgi:hypothetical protein